MVKAAKRGQDRRVDLPSIGPRTVDGARAGLGGIAVVAGSAVVVEPERIASLRTVPASSSSACDETPRQ
jgi:DUF1009 family protein